MLNLILVAIALIYLLIASYTDIRTREVPDWLNFSLIPLALSVRLIYSLAINEYSTIIEGLVGFGAFFVLALVMFYTGQWGGGDSKLLMGLGALIGLKFTLDTFIGSFLINTVIVGSVYGLIWSIISAIKNRKKFVRELHKIKKSLIKTRRMMLILFIVLVLMVIIIPDLFSKLLITSIIVVVYSTFYLMIFIKIVEKSCMLKYVKPTEVTEGDWIAKDVIIDKKRLTGPKDLGIERKELKKLISYYKKGKIKKVLIKVGIPFVPSFLVAYILTLLYGNVLIYLI
jgi:Flp pilus assembly protein protease CpaA